LPDPPLFGCLEWSNALVNGCMDLVGHTMALAFSSLFFCLWFLSLVLVVVLVLVLVVVLVLVLVVVLVLVLVVVLVYGFWFLIGLLTEHCLGVWSGTFTSASHHSSPLTSPCFLSLHV